MKPNVLAALEPFDVVNYCSFPDTCVSCPTFFVCMTICVVNIHPPYSRISQAPMPISMFAANACPCRDARFTWLTKEWTLEPVWPSDPFLFFLTTPKQRSVSG